MIPTWEHHPEHHLRWHMWASLTVRLSPPKTGPIITLFTGEELRVKDKPLA